MAHPMIQRHLDARTKMAASIIAVAEKLEGAAAAMPQVCPLPAGYACACTGACHPPEYYTMLMAAMQLRDVAKDAEPIVPKLPDQT